MAEALLKKLRPDIDVDSAGTHPAIPISEAAKKFLAEESAREHLKSAPESLDEKDISSYDLMIAMEPKHQRAILDMCSTCEDRISMWNIDDPYFLPYGEADRIFNQIKSKVLGLVNSLEPRAATKSNI